ncbi:MAG: helix-turn-helix domain-containing protein [Roseburia sp.]|nr:helix-turn-helix domain-containing protein [Anaeroplasma bactoclasticum]MCM1195501.1 helix-turn-helix domain-containing protein [Roseburia sp.]MCM1556879.1 helix-turn-helix domain-containing protein [Anaeroplasma bactoclasticum]
MKKKSYTKNKYLYWLSPQGLALLRGWARDGLTDDEIAHNMGISRSTLYEWKKKYSDLSDTLKEGKDSADYEIENALFNSAKSGNVTAMIFWLKNRKPSKWRERIEQEPTSNEESVVIEDDIRPKQSED